MDRASIGKASCLETATWRCEVQAWQVWTWQDHPIPAIDRHRRKVDRRSPIAQLVEHSTVNRMVAGSSPARGATLFPCARALPRASHDDITATDLVVQAEQLVVRDCDRPRGGDDLWPVHAGGRPERRLRRERGGFALSTIDPVPSAADRSRPRLAVGELTRRHPDMAREGDAERARRAIAHALGHLGDAALPVPQ